MTAQQLSIAIVLLVAAITALYVIWFRRSVPQFRDSHEPLPPEVLASVGADPAPTTIGRRPQVSYAAIIDMQHDDGRRHSLIVICTTGGGPEAAIIIANYHARRACPPDLGWTVADERLVDEHRIDATFYP